VPVLLCHHFSEAIAFLMPLFAVPAFTVPSFAAYSFTVPLFAVPSFTVLHLQCLD
jgi:hypothetical protein